jgi:hypothetical protein
MPQATEKARNGKADQRRTTDSTTPLDSIRRLIQRLVLAVPTFAAVKRYSLAHLRLHGAQKLKVVIQIDYELAVLIMKHEINMCVNEDHDRLQCQLRVVRNKPLDPCSSEYLVVLRRQRLKRGSLDRCWACAWRVQFKPNRSVSWWESDLRLPPIHIDGGNAVGQRQAPKDGMMDCAAYCAHVPTPNEVFQAAHLDSILP